MGVLLVAGCWLLVAGCWLLVAGCWSPEHIVLSCLGSSAAKATGVALERGGAGGEPKVPLVHHPLYPTMVHHPVWYKWYRDTSSRVVQVVLLVHRPAASCVRLHRVYNWVRAKVTDGGGWVWQAQENMSLFSLKHPRVADHALWWDICHWIFVLII